MSNVLRELAVSLGLEVDEASFAKGELFAKAVEFGLEKLVEVGKEAVEFFIDIAKESVVAADEIDKTAQSLGLTTTSLQELTYAGGLAGVTVEEMGMSIGLLSRNLVQAVKGSDEQAKLFSKLGIKVKDADGKIRSADDVLGDVAEKFKTMPDGAEKTATALELLGRGGKKMIPLLNGGAEGLADMRKEAQELGVVLDEETVKQGAEIKDNVERLTALWEGIKRRAGATIFPVLKRLTDGAIAWVKVNKDVIKQKIEVVLKLVARAAELAARGLEVMYGAGKLLYDGLSALVHGALDLVLNYLELIGPAGRTAAIIFGAAWLVAEAPILAIAAAIGGVLLVLNSIQRWREGKDSLFGDWMKQLDEWRKPSENDVWWVRGLKETVDLLHQAIKLAEDWNVLMGKDKPAVSHATDADRAQASAAKSANKGKFLQALAGGLPGLYTYANDADTGVDVRPAASPYVPTLPPGQGVTRASGGGVSNVNHFYITPPNGVSTSDVADMVQQRLDAQNEAAAAHLTDY